ncbi:hypothetical protein PVAND_001766 [Polypedilum vanderplanki]|uniref:Glucosidase II beta subunit N-terminal domain-containing protein n=1 Tax=Polypedilum vanderplanki TaxID=319348 RepID=A0A9J6BPE0_POLVA|nr:hypothetical protein PVAND_001766 [Polypedilum vanderplanki]
MRKVWIKQADLIPKPFYKRKLFIFFILVFVFSVIFIIYQFKFINQLSDTNRDLLITERHRREEMITQAKNKLLDISPQQAPSSTREIILGIRIRDLDNYQQKYPNQLFRCLDGSKEIPFAKVNDDYCDCQSDGSDETFTNACSNGKFYCKKQMRHKTGRGSDVWVPTSRINDKICDCTDCSDEFL